MRATKVIVPNIAALRQVFVRMAKLSFAKPLEISMRLIEDPRTIYQNSKLRAMEREIAAFTGDDPDDLHEILLARRFGTEEKDLGNGETLKRPARRSSDLSKHEMADYITWVQALAARELGMELA